VWPWRCSELAAFGSRSQATLEITYRKLSEHFRVGAQALADRKQTARTD
jgi:hypothetical protein